MKKWTRQMISLLVTAAMVLGFFPGAAITAQAVDVENTIVQLGTVERVKENGKNYYHFPDAVAVLDFETAVTALTVTVANGTMSGYGGNVHVDAETETRSVTWVRPESVSAALRNLKFIHDAQNAMTVKVVLQLQEKAIVNYKAKVPEDAHMTYVGNESGGKYYMYVDANADDSAFVSGSSKLTYAAAQTASQLYSWICPASLPAFPAGRISENSSAMKRRAGLREDVF